MHYLKSLLIRLILCFIPISLFSFFLTPITVYGSYILLVSFLDIVMKENFLIVNGFPFEIVEACVATTAYYLLWLLCFLTKDIKLKIRLKFSLDDGGRTVRRCSVCTSVAGSSPDRAGLQQLSIQP